MAEQALTALGSARLRFLDALPGRAEELSELAARLREDSDADAELQTLIRRQLQTLAASARLFEETELFRCVERALRLVEDPGTGETAGRSMGEDEGEQEHDVALGDAGEADPVPAAHPITLRGAIDGILEAARDSHAGRLTVRPVSRAAPRGASVSRADNPPPDETPLDLRTGEAPADRPIEVAQTVSGLLPAPAPIAVVVVDEPSVVDQVRAALSDARFDVSGSGSADQALRLMHIALPPVVLVGVELAEDPALDLVRRIRRDPISDVHHVLLVGEQVGAEQVALLGCDGSLRCPIDEAELRSVIDRLVADPEEGAGLRFMTEGTVDDIAERVAHEIRRGLVETLTEGRDERIVLEDTRELMSAAWSAIGRIRSHLGQRSGGRLRFRAPSLPPGPREQQKEQGGTFALAETPAARVIAGRRILVADDDPAVLWFFTGLLREAGATALEAKNGQEALELARKKRPHVVISDILMPRLDGFALCGALKRDVILADVPIILLSWKEDFLHRLRELNAGATGYLRKEASSREILNVIADALTPRARLEAQLRAGREVHGRVEWVGIVPLLETVVARRSAVRVVVIDAWNMFDITLRDGRGIGVTRTATDGSFARGERALCQLLGVRSGRYTVRDDEGEPRTGLSGPIDRVLQEAAKKLGAVLDAVSDRRLLRVARIALDETSLPGLLAATPAPLAEVVQRLREPGAEVRAWLLAGEISPQVLQDQLRELARRGVIVGVWDEFGVDLVEEALLEREAGPTTLVHLSVAPVGLSAPPVGSSATSSVGPKATPGGLPVGIKGPSTDPPPPPLEPTTGSASGVPAAGAWSGKDHSQPELDAALSPARVPAEWSTPPVGVSSGGRSPVSGGDAPGAGSADVPAGATPLGAAPAAREQTHEARPDDISDASEEGEAAAFGEEGAGSRVIVVATAILLGFLGYFGFRMLGGELPRQAQPTEAAAAATAATAQTAVEDPAQPPGARAQSAGEAAAKRADDTVGIDIDTSSGGDFGRVLPFIDRSRGIDVDADQGLLVVEVGEGAPTATQIRVGARSLGRAPLAIALPEGRHEIVFRQGKQRRFRYLVIRRGETRIVDVP